ncbi:DUF362 domain-containing protein [Halonatronum saccharophilum]|uniref:DUF362 domain-containing protein n=1 Tax=Halonatronum saccharophilum TaxID=150060 RepID=UPI000486D048|nr:DUF362 domain-containing protein [Halonatronum saccharophilum]
MKVAAVTCNGYEEELLDQKVRESLDYLGGIESFVKKGDKVLIKPNLLSPHSPEHSITTHPLILKAVIKLIKEAGGIVKVGESSGGMMVDKSLTQASFKATGVEEVCDEMGVEMVNFDREDIQNLRGEFSKESFPFPKVLLDSDLIITLPKLKTHSLTLFTGAIKNLYGCIPGMKKAEYHKLYPHPEDFAGIIVDIYSLLKPGLAIMDGVMGLEGNGPGATGTPCEVGVILASQNSVALDGVAASFLGYKYGDIPITRLAYQRGLGPTSFDQIEVLGDFEGGDEKYNLPSNAILSLIPRWILSPLFNSLMSQPVIVQKDCIKCGFCVQSCPQDVIVEKDNGLVIEEKGCIKCLCCQELCPKEAVVVKEHPLVRILRRIRGR